MGEFLNQYVTDLHTSIPLVVVAVVLLAVFGVLYNNMMSKLGDKKDGYTALFVAIGNTITLIIVAFFSWKAAVLVFAAFIASGTAMVVGDIVRSIKRREKEAVAKSSPRRKPLPYAAARLINDAYDELTSTERKLEQVVNQKKTELIPLVLAGVSKSLRFISEAKNTEGE